MCLQLTKEQFNTFLDDLPTVQKLPLRAVVLTWRTTSPDTNKLKRRGLAACGAALLGLTTACSVLKARPLRVFVLSMILVAIRNSNYSDGTITSRPRLSLIAESLSQVLRDRLIESVNSVTTGPLMTGLQCLPGRFGTTLLFTIYCAILVMLCWAPMTRR